MRPIYPWFLAALLAATACSKQADSGSTGAPAAKHAPAHATPGSHEDWCGEHEVPESMCTRCNSSLIAAFKATGDWCPEHGLPESQCRICNPDLKIERPPQKQAR
jgi:hypothetical protein